MLSTAAELARSVTADLHLCSLSFKLRETVVATGLPGHLPIHAHRVDAVSAATKLV